MFQKIHHDHHNININGWKMQCLLWLHLCSATKQPRYKKSTWSLISMNPKWFMDGMPSYPPFFPFFFVCFRFFKVPMLLVGCCSNVDFVKWTRTSLCWIWFVFNHKETKVVSKKKVNHENIIFLPRDKNL